MICKWCQNEYETQDTGSALGNFVQTQGYCCSRCHWLGEEKGRERELRQERDRRFREADAKPQKSFFWAMMKIDYALDALVLTDEDGEVIPGDSCGGIIREIVGEPWALLDAKMQAEEITPEDYCEQALALIIQVGRDRAMADLERVIRESQDQVEMIPDPAFCVTKPNS